MEKGISIAPGSSWSFHGKEVSYTAYGLEKFPFGHVVWKSVRARELTMYDLYLPLVQHPNPAAVIQAEKITGPVLLISSKMDTMWPSELAAKQVMKRLQDYDFPYFYQHLSYDYGGHLFGVGVGAHVVDAECDEFIDQCAARSSKSGFGCGSVVWVGRLYQRHCGLVVGIF